MGLPPETGLRPFPTAQAQQTQAALVRVGIARPLRSFHGSSSRCELRPMRRRGFHARARLVIHAITGSHPEVAGGLASPMPGDPVPATPEPRPVGAPADRCPPASRGGVARTRPPRPVPRPSASPRWPAPSGPSSSLQACSSPAPALYSAS